METLSVETLCRLYGDSASNANLIQIKLSFKEWNALAERMTREPWHYMHRPAVDFLVRHTVLCEGYTVLVL